MGEWIDHRRLNTKFQGLDVRLTGIANADDVMRDALQALLHLEAVESPEWEAELLAGVRSPHRPYGPDVLQRVREAANAPR
jgi:hypothetical protein